jgi:hypothetical protein
MPSPFNEPQLGRRHNTTFIELVHTQGLTYATILFLLSTGGLVLVTIVRASSTTLGGLKTLELTLAIIRPQNKAY